MDIRTAGVAVFLASSIASTEAAGLGGINDPRYCYALDVVLLLYCVFITALLLREKFCKPKASPQDSLYSDLSPHGDPYQQLRRDNDLETGAARANHRLTGDEVYTRLQKPDIDTYNQLQVKPERRRNKGEQVYQGLNTVTKDTYESLKMQPMPRPR
ncbi:T-cell surface glycoprotein CD3 zeta chain-like [Conger conger]|uniref:T-cell surface glycoprotein CD3 zeta chain-like n=1 Tax=Conger conger TaxID=82655 RepID=UPI002A5AED43|nr:T-cell surface glycoprotein CD3 zeta chain-like [Conger conger]